MSVASGTRSALRVADFQPPDVLDLHAIAGIGLDVDLPVAVLKEEVVDVVGAEIGLQRVVDVGQGDVLGLELFAVDVHIELRLGDAEGGEEGFHARLPLALVGHRLDGALQRPQPGALLVLNLHLDAAGGAEAVRRAGRRRRR